MNHMRTITIEEANRALNDLEIETVVLSETMGYNLRRLTMVHRPGRISKPIAYAVKLVTRMLENEENFTVIELFHSFPEAVQRYNAHAR